MLATDGKFRAMAANAKIITSQARSQERERVLRNKHSGHCKGKGDTHINKMRKIIRSTVARKGH